MAQWRTWLNLRSLRRRHRIRFVAALTCFNVIRLAWAADNVDPASALDHAFASGLAKLKETVGFVEDQTNRPSSDWKPHLQLLVGVKAVEGNKRTIYFVQLTTLPPPATNFAGGQWKPALRTNDWAWSASNRTRFITPLYPVRVRVFDEFGHQLKDGQTPMAWGMLTNGLLDLCRVSLEIHAGQTNSSSLTNAGGTVAEVHQGRRTVALKPEENEKLMRAMGGGFLWMVGMFRDLQTVPAVSDVWAKAQCAIRWPSAWSMAVSLVKGFTLNLVPRTDQVTLVNAVAAVPLYRLPVDLDCDKRNLTRVEIIVGQARGAEMLLAGIRSIRARHPARPEQEFLAQVLAAGSVHESK